MVSQTLSGLFGFVVTFVFSRLLLGRKQRILVAIKPELAKTQADKSGTPTIGGLAFLAGTLVSVVVFARTGWDRSLAALSITLAVFASIGFVDDMAKVHDPAGDGISSRTKLLLQAVGAAVVLSFLHAFGLLSTEVTIPFLSKTYDWGPAYFACAFLYILYFCNAVNIADGLDGLAAGGSLPLLFLLLAVSAVSGLSLFLSAFVGSVLAFLWFNLHPARYFMGDCGSQPLGAVIAVSALVAKAEWFVLIASGMFLVEFSSSLIQIVAIRGTGKKVFPIAPLHHVFEQNGMAERTIVSRYDIVSWGCTALAFLLLIHARQV
jgi:phospho-N-acetylmuramoyl-pentapeptide-transferase